MSLPRPTAHVIVTRIKSIVGFDANIMDQNALIIGSTDPARVDTFHQGAAEVLRTGQPLEIDRADAERLKGSRPGVNLPISLGGQVIGVVGMTGEPSLVRPYGELVRTMVELMVSQFVLAEQLQATTSVKRTLLSNVIHGNLLGMNEESMEAQARLFGYDPSVARLCVVFHVELGLAGAPEEGVAMRQLSNAVASVFSRDCISTYIGGGYLVALPAAGQTAVNNRDEVRRVRGQCQSVLTLLDATFTCPSYAGIGGVQKTLVRLNHSYADAMRTLRIGKALCSHPTMKSMGFDDRVFDLGSLGVYVMADSLDPGLTGALRSSYGLDGRTLSEALGDVLMSTLMGFLMRDMNVQRTASYMYVHRNTLIYRLDRVREITGKDPRVFADAVELALLVLHEIMSGAHG